MSRQLSFLKTRFFGTLQKLISILLGHLLKQGSYVSMELSSIHLLFRHFLAFLLVVIVFRAFVSPVSCVPTSKRCSFFHQLVLFVDHQSVDVHGIWVTFFLGEVILLLWGLLLPGVLPGLFYRLIHLVESVVECCCPLVPVVNGLEWCLEFHQLEHQGPGQCFLEQFNGQGVHCVYF
jgi:hypothetical protein